MCSQWTSPSPPNTHSIAAVSALPRHLRHLESTLSVRVCQAAHLSGVRCGQVHDGLLSSLPTFTPEILTNLHRLVMTKLLIGSWNPGGCLRDIQRATPETRVCEGDFWVSNSLPVFLSFSLWLLSFPLRCPNEFTGDRCQSYVMASFYSTSISSSCLCLDWSMLSQRYLLLLWFYVLDRQVVRSDRDCYFGSIFYVSIPSLCMFSIY